MPEIRSYVCTRSPLGLPVHSSHRSPGSHLPQLLWGVSPPSSQVAALPPRQGCALCLSAFSSLAWVWGVPSVQVSDSHLSLWPPRQNPGLAMACLNKALSQICLERTQRSPCVHSHHL